MNSGSGLSMNSGSGLFSGPRSQVRRGTHAAERDGGGEEERERERDRDRETERQRHRETETEGEREGGREGERERTGHAAARPGPSGRHRAGFGACCGRAHECGRPSHGLRRPLSTERLPYRAASPFIFPMPFIIEAPSASAGLPCSPACLPRLPPCSAVVQEHHRPGGGWRLDTPPASCSMPLTRILASPSPFCHSSPPKKQKLARARGPRVGPQLPPAPTLVGGFKATPCRQPSPPHSARLSLRVVCSRGRLPGCLRGCPPRLRRPRETASDLLCLAADAVLGSCWPTAACTALQLLRSGGGIKCCFYPSRLDGAACLVDLAKVSCLLLVLPRCEDSDQGRLALRVSLVLAR
jgi:hypothetical protein